MKKLENFLLNYSWLLKLGIFISIFLWAAQGNVLLKNAYEIYKKENAAYGSEDQAARSKAIQELDNYARNLTNEASTLSRQNLYGSKEYFNDLKKIRLKNKELYHAYLPISGFVMTSLQGMSLPEGLLRADKHKIKEIEEPREDYRQWLKTADVPKNVSDESFIKEDEAKKINWRDVLADIGNWTLSSLWPWLFALYRRSFFLVIFLYLVRMSQRKGILETVLADKKKFALAILAWPVFISKYPYNVVREIIVEAELRRIGNVFRKLNPKEKLRIRRIANSDRCNAWRQDFRSENKFKLRHSFIPAIIVTIFIHTFVPLVSSAETPFARGDPLIVAHTEIINLDTSSEKNLQDDDALSECIPETAPAIALYVSGRVTPSKITKRITQSRKIDRIPIGWLFSCSTLIPN